MSEAILVPLSRLVRDRHLWPRQQMAEADVRSLAEIYRHDGLEAVDPILVAAPGADGNYLVLDGWARVEGAEREGLTALLAIVRPVASDEEAYELAVRLSARGPRPLTRAEKRTAVDRLLRTNPRRADYAIAQIAGVSNHFVAKRRQFLQKPEAARASGDSQSAGPQRHALAMMNAAKAIDDAYRGEDLIAEDGSSGGEIGAALARAAQKCFGADAGEWLNRLEQWMREGSLRLRSGTEAEAVTADGPWGAIRGLERSSPMERQEGDPDDVSVTLSAAA
jgi:ParB-like nuclease domain